MRGSLHWTQPFPDSAPDHWELWFPGRKAVIGLQGDDGQWTATLEEQDKVMCEVTFECVRLATAKDLAIRMLDAKLFRLQSYLKIAKTRTR